MYCLVLVQSRQYLQFAYLGGKQLFANVFLRRCNHDKENSFRRWGHHKFLSIECTYIPAVKSSRHLSQLRDVIVILPELGLGHLWIISIDEDLSFSLLTTSYLNLCSVVGPTFRLNLKAVGVFWLISGEVTVHATNLGMCLRPNLPPSIAIKVRFQSPTIPNDS